MPLAEEWHVQQNRADPSGRESESFTVGDESCEPESLYTISSLHGMFEAEGQGDDGGMLNLGRLINLMSIGWYNAREGGPGGITDAR